VETRGHMRVAPGISGGRLGDSRSAATCKPPSREAVISLIGKIPPAARGYRTSTVLRSVTRQGVHHGFVVGADDREDVALFGLIRLEMRRQARTSNVLSPVAQGAALALGAEIRTVALLGLIATIFAAVGSLFGAAGAVVALAMAVVMAFWSFWHTGPAILAQCGARYVTDRNLIEAVQQLAAKAGIPAPRVFEIQETHPNAFALGSDPAHAAIVVTMGLRRRLKGDELRAVMAHEISHIANRDTLSATVGVTLLNAIAMLALWLGLIGLAARRQGGGALLFLAILAPISALVLHLAMSRSQEYQADREGAILCGNPDDLIRALIKLDASTRRVASITAHDQPALAALFIVDPLPNLWVGRLFATHPPIWKRIARLREMDAERG
jgi:heat shock protein HtpX